MEISVSKKRITPEGRFRNCYLCGHAIRTEMSKGVMDELYVNSMLLKQNGTILVFVSFDLIGMDRTRNEKIKSELSEKYNIPQENINIGYVHTHSAPEFSDYPLFGKEVRSVPGYMDYVEGKIKEAVSDCFHEDMKEVKAYKKVISAEGFYSNRNGLDKIGDTDITTVTFEAKDGTICGGFLNFTCHSTVLGPQNLLVSADLAGYLNRELQARWGVAPITMIGAAGDMSTRQLRQGNDYAELKRVGDGIMKRYDESDEHDEIDLNGNISVEKVDYFKEYTLSREKKLKQIKMIEEKLEHAQTFDEKKVYTSALAGAKGSLDHTSGSIQCSSVLYKIGGMFICSIPAELFSCFGIKIKKAMNAQCPIVWGYSNYSVGYLADIAEYGSSFETAASEIPAGTTEEIVEGIIDAVACMNDN